MSIDHPGVQSTLVPTFVTLVAWVMIRFVFRMRTAAPAAVVIAVTVVFVLVNGMPRSPVSAVDKMALAILVTGLLSLVVTYSRWSEKNRQWALLAAVLIGGAGLLFPSSSVFVIGTAIACGAVATLHWTSLRRDVTNHIACWSAGLITALGLGVLMLTNGSASTFQLLLALTVSWVTVVLCERNFSHPWTLQAGTLSAPLLLIAAYAARYVEVTWTSLATLGLCLLAPAISVRIAKSRRARLAVTVVIALLLAVIANWIGDGFIAGDDAYY